MQKKLFDIRSSIIKACEDGAFLLSKENLHKEQADGKEEEEKKRRKKKEETTPDWIKISAHSFKRIREIVNNYVNKDGIVKYTLN